MCKSDIVYFYISSQAAAGVNRWLLGWVLAFSILWALCRHLNSLISLRLAVWMKAYLTNVTLFNQLLQGPLVLGFAHSMLVYDASRSECFLFLLNSSRQELGAETVPS